MIPYRKTTKNTNESVTILIKRGLIIENPVKAEQYLDNIGYFRLSAYFYPLLKKPKTNHSFKENTSFKQAMNMYRFDRKLRLLFFNEIEKIEVALRSIMINEGCVFYSNPFWLTDTNCFYRTSLFEKTLDKIKSELNNTKEEFIIHFKNTYSDTYPPSWMIAQIMTLGQICKAYKNIKSKRLKKEISMKFGLKPNVFESWIFALAGIRNICCHHARLWNRVLSIHPTFPKWTLSEFVTDSVDMQRIYFRLCMVKYLLHYVSPNNTFNDKLFSLIEKYPHIDLKSMGFQTNWEKQSFWK